MRAGIVILVGVLVGAALAAPAAAAADTTPPTAPSNLRVTASTANSVTLAWNHSSDNSGAWTYILMDNVGNTTYHPKTQNTTTRTFLSPNTTYTYRVQAVDPSRNYSGFSNTLSHTTPPDTTPPTVPVLSLTLVAPARAGVTWTPSTDNSGFWVTYRVTVDGVVRPGDMNGGRTLLDLTPQTTYTVVVTARDLSGNTSASAPLVFTTPVQTDFTAPTTPGNLRGRTDFSQCEVYVSWDQSTDNVEPQPSILYRFRVNGQLAPAGSFVFGRGTNIGVTVLEGHHGGPNGFTVEGVDGSGNISPLSNELVLNLPADCNA